jgi:nudix motif 8
VPRVERSPRSGAGSKMQRMALRALARTLEARTPAARPPAHTPAGGIGHPRNRPHRLALLPHAGAQARPMVSQQDGAPRSPALKAWIPPKRWLPDKPTTGKQLVLRGGEDYRRILNYDVSTMEREPLPKDLQRAMQYGLKHLQLDAAMLTRITSSIAALPMQRIDRKCQNGRRAAVMLPLCVVDGKVSVLFNVRSQQVSTHKGEVCFPGGHLDPTDACMEATANRECEEEVGVPVVSPLESDVWSSNWMSRPYYPRSNILGRLPNCISVNGTLVTPVVGFLGSINIQAIAHDANKDEIAEVFSMTVEELLDQRAVVRDDMGKGSRMPAYESGPHRVWGLTALILHHFLMEVMLPSILTCPASLRERDRERARMKLRRRPSGSSLRDALLS